MNAPVQQQPAAPQQVVLNIKVTPDGLQFIIGALRKLPHDQVDDLVRELFGQGQQEVQRLQAEAAAAEQAEKEKAAAADRAAKKAAKAPGKKTEVAKAAENVADGEVDPLD